MVHNEGPNDVALCIAKSYPVRAIQDEGNLRLINPGGCTMREARAIGTTRHTFLIVALALLVGGLPGLGSLAAAEDALPADDAYHYRDWADARFDGTYTEWWYFNFFDAQRNLQAIFTYFVIDPANLTGHGLAQVAVVAYTPGGVIGGVDVYPPNAFSASYERADVQIEGSAIEVIDPGTYRIAGASRDGRLAWDLIYAKKDDAWFAADHMMVGIFPWEQMNWLVYMPRAAVSGSLAIDGQVYSVDAPGYHDHNWGEWIFTNALWNWAQYSEPGLSFAMGDFIGKPTGLVSIDVQGQRTTFTKDQYWLLHTRWAFDATNGKWYPVETLLFAWKETSLLFLTLRAILTHPLRGDAPFPFPDPIIYEQTAEYHGWLWQKDRDGTWELAAPFSGNGFKEYTARKWSWP